MAEDHGFFDDEGADGAVVPVVDLLSKIFIYLAVALRAKRMGYDVSRTYIAAADARELHVDSDIVGVFDLGDGSVLESHFLDGFEDEGEVLHRGKIVPSVNDVVRGRNGVADLLRGHAGVDGRVT